MTEATATGGPLAGLRVLDLSWVLSGPFCTMTLCDLGADVVKCERPPFGDVARTTGPLVDGESGYFFSVNRGKRSIAIDLKSPGAVAQLTPLLRSADVVVEQFRPGVMDRLGLGYDALKQINSRLIYCAITGYGQHGPRAEVAAHDLNYAADAGMLALAAGADGAPVLPAALLADIGGGSYPAVINILFALRQRDRTGEGCKLDIAMGDNLFTFMYWALGNGLAAGAWPRPGSELVTGGSPRYNIYRTRDDKFIAAAPLEQKFWENFCEAIQLPASLREDAKDARATHQAVADVIRQKTAAQWQECFSGKDVCCCVMVTVKEALADPHFTARGVFAHKLAADGRSIAALPVPVANVFRSHEAASGYPALGEANEMLNGRIL